MLCVCFNALIQFVVRASVETSIIIHIIIECYAPRPCQLVGHLMIASVTCYLLTNISEAGVIGEIILLLPIV